MTDRSQSFTYDQLNRISTAETTATHSSNPADCWGQAFTFDAWGNLLSISGASSAYTGCTQGSLSVTVTANNQITGDTYDAAGNLMTVPGTGGASYVYNAENQMTSTSNSSTQYVYDGDGNRVEKTGSKLYWYAGGEILDETDTTGSTTNSSFNEYYFFGGMRVARRDSSSNVFYYLADNLDSSRVIAEVPSGQTTPTMCYDADFEPYGGEHAYLNSCPQNYKFTGKERDSESGLDYFGARYYGSSMGRFMTPDPKPTSARLEDPQSWNRYAYTRNNPLKYLDPDGKDYQIAYNSKTNTTTVTINIVLTGPGATKQLAADWQKDTGAKIGGPHKTSFGMTLDIKVNVTTDPKSVPALGRNEMNVDPAAKKTEVTPTPDGKHANQGTGTPEDLSDPNVRTHETLHYGGLGDQYDPATNQPLAGQEGSLMGDPRNPNAQFTPQEVDQMGRNACNNNSSCQKQNPEPSTDKKPEEK